MTDPNLMFNLRAKLDALGYYDDYEVNRVVEAELNPASKQSDLVAAIFPVADRLLRSYREAQKRQQDAEARNDERSAKLALDEQNALLLFRADMGAYIRLYTFLSQIFDYGNTAIEARSIFFRRLIPLLEFGRQREATMPHLSLNYFRAAAIFLVVGVAMGLQMSISGQHNVTGAHAHMSLIGWVSNAIFGVYFALDPDKAESFLAKLQFWIVVVSSALMSGALYFLLLGYAAIAPVVAVASLAWGIGAVLFMWIVFSPRHRASAIPGACAGRPGQAAVSEVRCSDGVQPGSFGGARRSHWVPNRTPHRD